MPWILQQNRAWRRAVSRSHPHMRRLPAVAGAQPRPCGLVWLGSGYRLVPKRPIGRPAPVRVPQAAARPRRGAGTHHGPRLALLRSQACASELRQRRVSTS